MGWVREALYFTRDSVSLAVMISLEVSASTGELD